MIGSLIDNLRKINSHGKKYSPITLSILGLVLGGISLALWFLPTDLRFTFAAFFFNVSILGLILLFLEFTWKVHLIRNLFIINKFYIMCHSHSIVDGGFPEIS